MQEVAPPIAGSNPASPTARSVPLVDNPDQPPLVLISLIAGVGEPGLTVNQVFTLSRFDPYMRYGCFVTSS